VIKVALRGLAGRKLRAVLTGIAIVLGVAMISGTYILTDTVQSAFTNLFTDSYAGTDAVVTGRGLDISIDGEKPPDPPIPASLLGTVRGVDGVALATGTVADEQSTKVPDTKDTPTVTAATVRNSRSLPARRLRIESRSMVSRPADP
jgi:putative ABC transport system permease protein